jgi:DNA polymerase
LNEIDTMPDDLSQELDERGWLVRQVRHRLESLRRAGLVQIPAQVLRKPSAEDASRDGEPARVGSDAPEGKGESMADKPKKRHAAAVAPVDSPGASRPVASPRPRATAGSRELPSGSLFDESGFDTPVVPASERPTVLADAAAEVAICTRCPHLAAARTKTVFGTGSPTARLMFIGEAPGADEDRLGEPFVGRAGQLLTDMITKGMGLRREDVYIANVIKCRPPDNRPPTAEEAANCSSYLEHQIAVIRPEFLCLLGRTAAAALLEITPSTTMGQLRGKWRRYRGIPTLVTYHPSYLLRVPSAKKDAWEDLQILMKEMGLPVPRRK